MQLIVDRMIHVPGSGLGALVKWQLTESADGKKMIARGEFARAGVATENKRVYPKALWVREISSLRESISERKVFGEVDHPNDGRTKLGRVSHLLTSLDLDGDVVMGEVEILDTDIGRNLKAILKGGGAVGVSSRGYGTTAPGPQGEEIVQDDYKLMTFDFVAEPANVTSYPAVYQEHRDQTRRQETDMDLKTVTIEQLKKDNPALVESIFAGAKTEFEKQLAENKAALKKELLNSMVEMKQKALEEAREQLSADPSIAGARATLEGIKRALKGLGEEEGDEVDDKDDKDDEKEEEIKGLKAKLAESDIKIRAMEEQLEKLSAVTRQAGYQLHLERKLKGEAKGSLIAKAVGDVRAFESLKALDAKLEAVRAEVNKQVQAESRQHARIEALEEENAKLRESTKNALKVGRDVAVTLYIERKVMGRPDAKHLKAMIESKNPQTKQQVDQMYESLAHVAAPSSDEATRIRKRLGRAREQLLSEEEKVNAASAVASTPDAPVTGVLTEEMRDIGGDLADIRALAGING